MRTCLNLVTLQRGLDPIVGIKAAAKAGFQGVGLWADALEAYAEKHGGLEDVVAALADNGILAEEICYTAGYMWPENETAREAALDDADRKADYAATVGAPCVIACAAGTEGDLDVAAADLRIVADVTGEFGVVAALEYIGMFPQIKDLKTGLDVVRRAQHPDAKLLIDVFHSFRGGTAVEDFALPKGDEVALVHINDVPAGDVFAMADSDRVLPGQGVLPLKQALGSLGANGYTGALSVEIFSEYWWAQPIDVTAKAAHDALASVLAD
jgi:2-keto-myo-inositol isomerase